MKSVSVSEAKSKLSAILRRVAGGETVLILSRGKTVARLCPAGPADLGSDEERLALMEREGILRRASKPPTLAWLKLPRPTLPEGSTLLDALLKNREEER